MQNDQQKAAMMERINQLEMQKSEEETATKEHELSELRWKEQWEEIRRAKEGMEKQLEDACRLIALLKSRLQQQAKLAYELEEQRGKTSETREEVMKCKLAYAEMKGNMDTQVVSLEKELDHVQRTLKCEKTRTSALQGEIAGLSKRLQQQQCITGKLNAKEALRAEHHATERTRLQKEVGTLEKSLQRNKQTTIDAVARVDELQQL
ncbi:hypothetical protein G195_010415 [Phytophthora kernoviae 00238/432]|uniref:Uncharacterized protein n=1 Tax=Phytophthora kernoviae 00238/432 TaxID=1284355 RepID=A0A8J4RUX7_9STRA|nr:hypothetical protein G195_010415 [Phytophthora kernoviae 00238/432]